MSALKVVEKSEGTGRACHPVPHAISNWAPANRWGRNAAVKARFCPYKTENYPTAKPEPVSLKNAFKALEDDSGSEDDEPPCL